MTAGSEPRCAVDALEQLLERHPGIAWLDALVIDLNGVVRGKRYPREDVDKLCRSGMQFPLSGLYLDATGECLDPLGLGVSDGDPDGTARLIPETLVPVSWGERPGAQALLTMHDVDGAPSEFDPRVQAARALERLSRLGVTPVCAFELEFYLLDGGSEAAPRAVPGHGQVYRMEEVGAAEALLDAVRAACDAQGIPASIVTSEYAAGQFEINLRHVPDALAAADHAVMFKRLLCAVARNHGMRATFMAKPFLDCTGSGTHVHLSLLDADGGNLFDESRAHGEPRERLAQAVAGVLEGMPDAMLLYAPNYNSYRRFVPRTFVPVNRSWGYNNRSVAVRIPAGEASARRIEFRVPGADANPYLVLAALLVGVRRGLEGALVAPPPASGNVCLDPDPDLPMDWARAIERFAASRTLAEEMGERLVAVHAEGKRLEARKFQNHIPDREYAWYL